MNLYKKWASREYSLGKRLLGLIPAAVLFLFLIPYILLVLGPRLDTRLGLPGFYFGWINILACVLLAIVGGYYALSSIGQQLFDAGGTPIPVMATQKLLVRGVFKQCRNPMTFGTISMYLGLAIFVGSISSTLLVMIFLLLLVLYLKKIEEHELELRFGESYKTYKANTPFLIPRIFYRNKPAM